jgi:uncharacterized damage-inducible protein DinB
MKINKNILLTQLTAELSENILLAKQLLNKPVETLKHSPGLNSWSILQVIDHLNTYNNYYLPQIKSAVADGFTDNTNIYKSSFIGDYFVKMMQPVNQTITKKYKAAKRHLPKAVNNPIVIDDYITQQQELLTAIQLSVNTSLTKNKIAISISPIIKLRLGDVYRFLIAHQQRHFVQIGSCVKQTEPCVATTT